MKKTKVKYEGKQRIYVLVAEKIFTNERGVVIQPSGRQVAQVAHVVSKMRYLKGCDNPGEPWYSITTIVLQARDTNELEHVYQLLHDKKISAVGFWDRNTEAYGVGEFLTAICTEPIFKEEGFGAVDYLPLWGS